ncbi:hypothetical protein NDU88_001391 [Pleurodeles waltl]|uniref:Uncharacterized protein n=1 Tax=Pleurodeles waltl TaxID=8319 RepID=A0AAV7RCQ4_PLEWA|nr:hypothetical protein NDU88_001391 [Pleurodeles waltl]
MTATTGQRTRCNRGPRLRGYEGPAEVRTSTSSIEGREGLKHLHHQRREQQYEAEHQRIRREWRGADKERSAGNIE